jgi:hypothetical protein
MDFGKHHREAEKRRFGVFYSDIEEQLSMWDFIQDRAAEVIPNQAWVSKFAILIDSVM